MCDFVSTMQIQNSKTVMLATQHDLQWNRISRWRLETHRNAIMRVVKTILTKRYLKEGGPTCQKDDERLDPNFKLSKQITTPT